MSRCRRGERARYSRECQAQVSRVYDVADEHFEPGPAFQEVVAQPTPWSRRMRTLYGEDRERMNFRLMRDVGRVSETDTPWLYIVHTDIPDHIVDEYNEWYDNEHLPRLVTVPGVVRARRYAAVSGNPKYLTAYELTDKDAFESPAGLAARKTPWTARCARCSKYARSMASSCCSRRQSYR